MTASSWPAGVVRWPTTPSGWRRPARGQRRRGSPGSGGGYVRDTHHAGGVEGGISTGSPIVARASMKPLATLNRPTLGTVDVVTKESTVSFKERTDVTAVPAMGVVAETMVALVLASEALRKFGGDSVEEFRRNRLRLSGRAGGDALGGRRAADRWLTGSSWWA